MTNVNRSTACGNSPKNKMVEDIAVALETDDARFISAILDSGGVWNDADSGEVVWEDILSELRGQNKQDRKLPRQVESSKLETPAVF